MPSVLSWNTWQSCGLALSDRTSQTRYSSKHACACTLGIFPSAMVSVQSKILLSRRYCYSAARIITIDKFLKDCSQASKTFSSMYFIRIRLLVCFGGHFLRPMSDDFSEDLQTIIDHITDVFIEGSINPLMFWKPITERLELFITLLRLQFWVIWDSVHGFSSSWLAALQNFPCPLRHLSLGAENVFLLPFSFPSRLHAFV